MPHELLMGTYAIGSPKQELINYVARRWPNFTFAMGRNPNGNNTMDVWKDADPGTNLPPVGVVPVVSIEFASIEHDDVEVLLTKLIMVCG